MLKLKINESVAELTISRPDVKNAINSSLINMFFEKLSEVEENINIRVLIIRGENGVFSSGADLNWLRDVNNLSYQEIYDDSMRFTELLDRINGFSIPVISIVDGAAIGGGAGIALSSDIVIGTEKTIFGISELYYGIVPVAIVPIVKQRIGETLSRELLVTGERIEAKRALQIGLLNYLVSESELNDVLNKLLNRIIYNAPNATKKVREMIRNINKVENLNDYIAKEITELRLSEEGKEGINAFLNKSKAKWHKWECTWGGIWTPDTWIMIPVL